MADYTTDAIVIAKAEVVDRNSGPEIVYVNSFTELTGYRAEEAIGMTPSVLQGPKTDKRTMVRISRAIESKTSVTVRL